MSGKARIYYAAIDIGTSQIKLGVASPAPEPAFRIIGYRNTRVQTDADGKATVSYSEVRTSIFGLLGELGTFLSDRKAEKLCIGICGLVSSYLIWDRKKTKPVSDTIPIWLDRSCSPTLERLFRKLAGGNDIRMLGTHLPKGTNWLLSKIYFNKKRKLQNSECYLQLGDAIFAELTGTCMTHFSSQVSIAHNTHQTYSNPALKLLGCTESDFPPIKNSTLVTIGNDPARQTGLPADTLVAPALSDFYASFIGVDPNKKQGFILANTSEIAGKALSTAGPVKKFVTVKANNHTLVYGSTNTGGNVLNWLIRDVLNKEIGADTFNALNSEAEKIAADASPIFVPFIDGERSPLWDNELTGAFFGLTSAHTAAHLFRAVLEGIAFCRRYQFDSMPGAIPPEIIICGGNARNDLFNRIRASVLNRKLLRSSESELAIAGTIRHAALLNGEKDALTAQTHAPVRPDPVLKKVYEKKYRRFKQLMKTAIKEKTIR